MLAGTVLYVVAMLTVVRRGLRRLERVLERHGGLSQDIVAIVVFFILASAWTTERLGVHAAVRGVPRGSRDAAGRRLVRPLLDRCSTT